MPKGPLRVDKVIQEHRRRNADKLVNLGRDVRKSERQSHKCTVAYSQGKDRNQIELDAFDTDAVLSFTPAERPVIIQ